MGDAIYVPQTADDIAYPGSLIPASTTRLALDWLAGQTGLYPNWVNVKAYGAAGVTTTTTLAASLPSGSTSASLSDASSYAIGNGIAIPGAGVSGAEFVVTITNIIGNTIYWSGTTSTTVNGGITVYHDDTQAFLNAIASWKNVYFPKGNYNLTQTLLFGGLNLGGIYTLWTTAPSQRMEGEDIWNTRLYLRRGNIYAIQVLQNNLTLRKFSIWQDPNTSVSTGGGITLGRNRAFAYADTPYFLNVEQVFVAYVGTSLQWINGMNSFFKQFMSYSPVNYGMYYDSTLGPGGMSMTDNCWFLGNTASPYNNSIGWYVLGADGTGLLDGISISRHSKNMVLAPVNADIAQWCFSELIMDECGHGTSNVEIGNTGSYNVRRLTINGYRTGTSSPASAFIIGSRAIAVNISDIETNGCWFVDNGVNTKLDNGSIDPAGNNHALQAGATANGGIYRGLTASNTSTTSYDAFNFVAGATNCILQGCKGTVSRYGLNLPTSVTNCVITGNNFLGNNTAASSLGSGVLSSNIIKNNQGIADYLASVASTPDYIGEVAITGGIAYMATGTSSSADWKQISN